MAVQTAARHNWFVHCLESGWYGSPHARVFFFLPYECHTIKRGCQSRLMVDCIMYNTITATRLRATDSSFEIILPFENQSIFYM